MRRLNLGRETVETVGLVLGFEENYDENIASFADSGMRARSWRAIGQGLETRSTRKLRGILAGAIALSVDASLALLAG